jgi:hypothetical protein
MLHEMITSPLLHYRILATFGTPKETSERLDDYKSIWEVELYWTGDDGLSVLRIYDNKGGAAVQFYACQRASTSARQLIEWLISDNVPHPYDGVLAGTVA